MNIVLLDSCDWINDQHVRLTGRRAHHLTTIIKVTSGDSVRVGQRNGLCGHGTVLAVENDAVDLSVVLDQPPPDRHPFTLVMALPRPKMLRRVLRTCAEFGVSDLHLIHSYRVEKSYWQSPLLGADRIEAALEAGLERCGDTIAPRVFQHRRFRPFIEDVLPELSAELPVFVAHPGSHPKLSCDQGAPAIVMIGPEGGFIPFELELAAQQGAELRHIGRRIFSVDTAVATVLAREIAS